MKELLFKRTGSTLVLFFCIIALVLFSTFAASSAQDIDRGGREVLRMYDENDALIPPDAPRMPLGIFLSGDYRIDSLLSTFSWPQSMVTYSFYEDDVFHGTYYGSETGVQEVSEAVKTNVRAIMAWYSTLMNLDLVEVTETSTKIGQIRILKSTAPTYAYAYYPGGTTTDFSRAGDVHLNTAYDRLGDTNGFQHPAGEHGYVTLIHEIGHALGLKHPHDASPNLPAAEDTHTFTVMSYNFRGESPGTPMGYDIMALQHLYGVRAKNGGDDTYALVRATVDQYSLGGRIYITPSYSTKQAIWDSGGYNTLDLSSLPALTSGYRFDLNPLGWLSTNNAYLTTYLMAGLVLGPGMAINEVIGTVSDDTFFASDAANIFKGYAAGRVTGNDTIYGADAADTIDLSGYSPSQVTQRASGADLIIGLGANGTITLKNYYGGDQPAIVFKSAVTVSIQDASVNEGNSGTARMSFPVVLSTPAPATLSVHYATANGSAIAGSDYVSAAGVVTFAPGEKDKTIGVEVIGDTVVEGAETFFVNLSAPSQGLQILDGQAEGLIINDDVPGNQAPVAVASATPSSGTAPLAVVFRGNGSYDPDGSVVSYAWTFGDGFTSNQANPSHTYSTAGTFTATLTVADNAGATASTPLTVTVTSPPINKPPVAAASATPTSGTAPLAVTFTSSGSYDPDGTIVSYAWTFGDGATSTEANPSHTYSIANTYSANLTVKDNSGATASKALSLTVRAATLNKPPVAAASATPTSGMAPLAVTFTGSGSYDPDGTIVSYAWAFGDGATSTEANPSHTYSIAGTFTARLTVTDNRGAAAIRSLTITSRATALYSVYISDIKMEALRRTTGPYGKATVTILNQSGRASVSATVKGTWSNGTTTYSRIADSYGRAYFTSPTLVGGGTLTFTVTDVVKAGYTYDPGRNVERSDSITLTASAPTQPAAITDLSATVGAPDEVKLAWSAAAGGVKEYQLYRNGRLVASTTTPGYTDMAAPKGVLTYRLRVVDEQGRLSKFGNTVKVDLR